MNRRKFLRGVAVSPIAIAAVSLPKEAAPKEKPMIQPLPQDYYLTTIVSSVGALPSHRHSFSAWKLGS